jgi:hypothetical protein
LLAAPLSVTVAPSASTAITEAEVLGEVRQFTPPPPVPVTTAVPVPACVVGEAVGVRVGVEVGVRVGVAVGVRVGVAVIVAVGVGVRVPTVPVGEGVGPPAVT